MRIRLAQWMIGLSTLATGCQLPQIALHNLTYETRLAKDQCAEHFRYQQLAQEQWALVCNSRPGKSFSRDYAEGFQESFTDYLEFGGNGQPPFVPPQRYWGPRYRTPDGYFAIEDWYAGFRHGVAAAQESGYRQWITVPSPHSKPAPVPVIRDRVPTEESYPLYPLPGPEKYPVFPLPMPEKYPVYPLPVPEKVGVFVLPPLRAVTGADPDTRESSGKIDEPAKMVSIPDVGPSLDSETPRSQGEPARGSDATLLEEEPSGSPETLFRSVADLPR